MRKPFIIAHIVPTGIKAEIGGFVGDATPVTNLLASVSDYVITHPNVVNGVILNLAKENILYVEGFMLDQFFLNKIGLKLRNSNKIGVIIEKTEDKDAFNLIINTINTIKSNKGINVVGYEFAEPLGNKAVKLRSGAYVGEIKNITALERPAKKLIDKGAEVLAITTSIEVPEKDLELYFKGECPNPYGGTEAIISHYISKKYNIPTAHAPILNINEIRKLFSIGIVDPRAAAEVTSPAYLGSVLQGLHRAPKPINLDKTDIKLEDVSAIIVPSSCLGGIPVLSAEKNNIPIIAVEENRTVLKVIKKKLNLKNVIKVDNYLEAVGVILSLKEGIDIESVRRDNTKEERFNTSQQYL